MPVQFSFSGQHVSDTYQRVLQVSPAGEVLNGLGDYVSLYTPLSLSAGTYFSGSTPLQTIIESLASSGGGVSALSNGTNTYTGGSVSNPSVNVSAATLDSIFVSGSSLFNSLGATSVTATTLSGGTIFSGSTDLSLILASITAGSNDITRVQLGTNTYTGGTGNFPTVNVSGLTVDNILVSGASRFNSLSATTMSGGTIYSGSTELGALFSSIFSSSNDITRIQPGINTFTGGTDNFPSVNVSAATLDSIFVSGTSRFNSLSASTLSGGTIFSGSTDLEGIFHQKSGYLLQKSGVVSGTTFGGNPKTATVVFDAPFPTDNYAVTVDGEATRIWTVTLKASSGFTINSNANPAFATNVYWLAQEAGEGFR